jgi:CheY-like chemotaxis protein/MinD-like ATPase involved in chromosome partitioning or flagellar assembly
MAEKILIVDDDIDSLKLIGLMLQRHGYEVVAANAGNQAIAKAASDHPDLIILDVMMPDMDGYEVTRRLRSNAATQNIPIIMFTAKTLIDDKVKAFELGADDYLTKPTHPAELASRVKAILARNPTKGDGSGSHGSLTLGVMGVKGGVGTTTIAMNIAAAMLQPESAPIIADFCLGYGTMGLFLGHNKASSMSTLLSQAPNEITERAVEEQLITHQSGLRLLLSSSRPKEALLNYAPETALELAKILKKLSSTVVLDLGNHMTPAIGRVIRAVDQLLVVVEPNKVALTMARELFHAFETDGIEREKLNIAVINRAQSSLQTPWQEIEQALGQEIKAIISAAPDLSFQAIEANTPLVLFRPNSITASQIVKLAEDFRVKVKNN